MASSTIENFDEITNKINIPTDIQYKAFTDTSKLLQLDQTKDTLGSTLKEFSYSLKVEPFSYVDETKYYTYIDAAYKIYEQMTTQKEYKVSNTYAWCLANVAMYNWFFRHLMGITLTGREVQREVDFALRSPSVFMMKNCLMGTIQATALIGGAFLGFGVIGLSQPQLYTLAYYIISSIINLIKVSFRIYKGSGTAYDPIKPSA